MWRRHGLGLLTSMVLVGSVALAPGPAAGFGTIEDDGQNREHDRITRAALACHADRDPDDTCFAPGSVDQLAGHGRKFGAVGSPDLTETFDPTAHCDDADYLADGYPRTREQATASLHGCVHHLRERWRAAVDAAAGLLDDQGRIAAAQVDLGVDCELGGQERRAKCTSLEGFGRALHGAQDFYSHSNWADESDPTRPIGADNPPGLNRPAPSPVLDLGRADPPTVPAGLTTGCFVLPDSQPGVGGCERRITHAGLNKDRGLVDPRTGEGSGPTTPRGRVGTNFAKAVTGAIVETRHQWREFRSALRAEYGPADASLMVCALTRDDPPGECGSRHRAVALTVAGVLAVGLLAFGVYRRRRRGHPLTVAVARPPGSGRRSPRGSSRRPPTPRH